MAIKKIAMEEGRHTDAIVDEAFTDLIEKKKGMRPRGHVMQAYQSSHKKYDELYRLLAQ